MIGKKRRTENVVNKSVCLQVQCERTTQTYTLSSSSHFDWIKMLCLWCFLVMSDDAFAVDTNVDNNDNVRWFNTNWMRKRFWTWTCTLNAWQMSTKWFVGNCARQEAWSSHQHIFSNPTAIISWLFAYENTVANTSYIDVCARVRAFLSSCLENIKNYNDFQSTKKKNQMRNIKPSEMNMRRLSKENDKDGESMEKNEKSE